MKNIFLDEKKPKGIGPIKPPTATFDFSEGARAREEIKTKIIPMKIKIKPM